MLIHARTKSLVFQAADPLAIRELLPKCSKTLGQTTDGNIAVRHNIETTRVLRNLGIDAPSPLCHYDWPGKYTPYAHQRVMADMSISYDKCFNLSEMGTGKTYASLWAADYLMKQGLVKRCLVITTLSTMHTIWKQDIFDVLMHRTCVVVHGTPEKRAKSINMDVDFYITNHDGIALADVAKVVRKRKDIDLIILDEAAFFRNHKTDKYKFLNWVMEKKKRLWMLTGTPTPNEPTDAWALIRMINPAAVSQFKGNFKRETMVELKNERGVNAQTGKVYTKWAPKKGYEKIVFAAMQPARSEPTARCTKRWC
jgi:thymidine kinase